MPVKKCALCKKTAYQASKVNTRQQQWLCNSCRTAVSAALEITLSTETAVKPSSGLCEKCKKRTTNCRFSAFQRTKMTACSDWEGKNTERNRRRWAKFEN